MDQSPYSSSPNQAWALRVKPKWALACEKTLKYNKNWILLARAYFELFEARLIEPRAQGLFNVSLNYGPSSICL